MKTVYTFLLACITCLCMAQATVKNVDAATFKTLISEKKSILIDLRTSDEIKSKGKIIGATQIDFLGKDAESSIARLDKKKTYLIYCSGGVRSADCGELMQKLGFTSIVNLDKGYDDWKKKGFDTTKKQ